MKWLTYAAAANFATLLSAGFVAETLRHADVRCQARWIVTSGAPAMAAQRWTCTGFASIGLSYLSYFISRGKKGDDKAQSDRWGIFIGHWAPTFFALGVALKLEEQG